MWRAIKNFFVDLWVWLTPRAAKYKIQSEFMRQMTDPDRRPRFAQLAHPLRRRVDYGALGRSMIQVEKLPEAARPSWDRE